MISKENFKTVGWFLAGGVTAMLVFSSLTMLVAGMGWMPKTVEMFDEWGLGGYIIFIALTKLLAAILFMNRSTSLLGLIMLSSYMGGAIVTTMQHNQNYVFASITLLLIWAAGYFRNPEFFGKSL